ncbi:MAG: Ig domain-containing protein, partial [Chloroflexota bacterium]
ETNMVLGTDTVTTTVLDNDVATPTATIDVSQDKNEIVEGESVTYTITSDVDTDQDMVLDISLYGVTINPIDGNDLISDPNFPGNMQVSFTTGDTLQFTVTPDDDADVEADESMRFSLALLSAPSNVQLGVESVDTLVLNNDVVDSAPTIQPILNQTNIEGDSVNVQVDATDNGALSYSDQVNGVGTLPQGLAIDASTGLITGIVADGTAINSPYAVTITVTDTQGQTATANFTWTINSRPPAITIPNIDVCWIEDPNGNSTAWRITNDNPVPFTPNTQERIVFDWEVTLNGNFVQQAHNHSQTGEFRLNTPLSNQIEVVFKIWDNGIVKATQTVIATREQHPCNPPVVVTPEAPEVVVTTPEATQATDVPAVTEVVVV